MIFGCLKVPSSFKLPPHGYVTLERSASVVPVLVPLEKAIPAQIKIVSDLDLDKIVLNKLKVVHVLFNFRRYAPKRVGRNRMVRSSLVELESGSSGLASAICPIQQ